MFSYSREYIDIKETEIQSGADKDVKRMSTPFFICFVLQCRVSNFVGVLLVKRDLIHRISPELLHLPFRIESFNLSLVVYGTDCIDFFTPGY